MLHYAKRALTHSNNIICINNFREGSFQALLAGLLQQVAVVVAINPAEDSEDKLIQISQRATGE